VLDTFWFGNFLPLSNPNLSCVRGDIRDTQLLKNIFKGVDAVIHLACISNDASFELDNNLSTSINLLAFEPLVLAAKNSGVKRFIYASSSSVYGVSDKENVTEEHPLVPLTLYNRFKGECEPILFKHANKTFEAVVFRPATVCGYSPRQRLDLSVNILTNHAVNRRRITVFGGTQLRPNLHIQDYCDVVVKLLKADSKLISNEIGQLVKKSVQEKIPGEDIEIENTLSDDLRSYHINSDKIKKVLGFTPRHTIEEAVEELCDAFLQKKLPDSMTDIRYYNVKQLKSLKVI
jgi:nucleoside-diphosphate-sugar epimerase